MSKDKQETLNIDFFKTLCESFPVGLAIYDSDFTCLYINKYACKEMGISIDSAVGKKLQELVPGIEQTERFKKYCNTLNTGKPENIYFCKELKDDQNSRICYDVKSSRVQDKLVLIVEDITEEKNVEILKDLRLDSLMENLSAHIFFKDKKFVYTSVNKVCAEFNELEIDEMVGKTDYDLFDKELADKIRSEDKKVIEKGLSFENIERQLENKYGNSIWVSTTKIPQKGIDGEIYGLMGMSFDITDRKIVETEVELLISTMHQTSEAIIITDTEGVIQYVNPAFEKVTGFALDETIGKTPAMLKSGEHDSAFYDDLWKTLNKGMAWSGHFINKKKDGSIYEEDATISPVRNLDGDITNFVGVKKDVTNEKKLEEQLRQSQKMEAVGRLAGGIAHDFNNILTAILGYSELLLVGIDDDDPKRSKIEEIKKAGERASSLTRQMLTFSKKQVIQPKRLCVNQAINDMYEMLIRIIGENIKLELDLNEELDDILSDKGQIEQIIMNLVVNAKDAIPDEKGIITIMTDNYVLETEFKDGNFEAFPGKYIKIYVEDNGCGMGEETLDHIFEPFFSNRKNSKGTGLGLSTVFGIVKQHEGYIEVITNPGEGTTFNIYLPVNLSEETISIEDTVHGEESSNDLAGHVLLVEDESAVLNLASSILNLNGFKITTATNAEEALEKFENSEDKFDLLISDIVLPGKTGNELGAELKEKNPDLKILYMSGYSGEIIKNIDLSSDDISFIPKPFSMENFSKKLKEVIGGNVGFDD